jgi:hypothetical protein
MLGVGELEGAKVGEVNIAVGVEVVGEALAGLAASRSGEAIRDRHRCQGSAPSTISELREIHIKHRRPHGANRE